MIENTLLEIMEKHEKLLGEVTEDNSMEIKKDLNSLQCGGYLERIKNIIDEFTNFDQENQKL